VNEEETGLGLFGRQDALRVVDGLLDEGGSAVVVGAPGSGKTSLMKAAARMAVRHGRRVLSVAPTQFEQGLPFAGLAELIGQCPEGIDRDLPLPQRRALAVALQHADSDDGEINALAVPLAIRGVIKLLCAAEPVALLVDDLQWLDQSTIGSLGFAIRGASTGPGRLSVLIATRPDPDSGTDLLRNLTEPRHDVLLRPLEEAAIGQLLRSRLGLRWTPPMSAGVARASAGNPFHALEIGKAMQARGHQQGGVAWHDHDPVFPVPPTLAGLLAERVGRLPQDARDVLLLISAAGRLTLAQLRVLVDEDRLVAALEAAADAEVTTVGAESAVAFTHPLLSSAIYDGASPADRRRVHRLLADRLEDPVERARHRAKSSTVPDEAVAVEIERAAEISRARGARRLAGELFEAAARATVAEPGGGNGFDRWLRATDAYLSAGDEITARAALDRGSAVAADSLQQARALLRRVRFIDEYHQARLLLEQAFRLSPPESELRAEILASLGTYHRMEGHGSLALRFTRLAMAHAREHQRPDILIAALNEQQCVERIWGIGDPEQTLREFLRLVAAGREDTRSKNSVVAWGSAFFAPWNDAAAEARVREAITHAVDTGRYSALAHLYICLIFVLIRHSKVREAQAAIEEADRMGAWTRYALVAQEDMAKIPVAAYAGDLERARALARRAVARPLVGSSPYWRGGFLAQLGFIEVSAGNWQAALDAFRPLVEICAATKMVDLEQLLWAVDYADAALQAGSVQEVETAIGILRRQAAAGRPEASVAADRCHALLLAAEGSADEAVARLRAIVGQPESECPFEAARSRLALGQVYRRAGFKATADETLSAAAQAFADLGVPRWAERARAEADRVGLHPGTDTLTATERRVAELVAKGRSNQETADELFMSVKTVEANLTRIYRKLSVRSRTELANRLAALASTPG
jgi:DNA-binding CsgD family transcriptional regulator